jgi:2-polyprenyl-3-methyl-5-hydroxy-6-metoxy-1,4-benzoquinol methylase
MSSAKFDAYARNYDELHNQNLAASGESTEYFAEYKLACLKRAGAPLGEPLLDYGCGIGNVTHVLGRGFTDVHGFDPSTESIQVVRERMPGSTFYSDPGAVPSAHFTTAVLSGVLHHVPRPDRVSTMQTVLQKLRPGGRVFIFEHNPLNPATRHAVATCPFDDDADMLFPWQAKRLLRDAGFADVKLDFIVFFPRPLAFLRPLEPKLGWLPGGAQVVVTGTR